MGDYRHVLPASGCHEGDADIEPACVDERQLEWNNQVKIVVVLLRPVMFSLVDMLVFLQGFFRYFHVYGVSIGRVSFNFVTRLY